MPQRLKKLNNNMKGMVGDLLSKPNSTENTRSPSKKLNSMKHCILVKFKTVFSLDDHIEDIKRIFDSIKIKGLSKVEYIRNCVDRENRYDFLIRINIEKECLSEYDSSNGHHEWKEKYGQFVEKKAIFDYED